MFRDLEKESERARARERLRKATTSRTNSAVAEYERRRAAFADLEDATNPLFSTFKKVGRVFADEGKKVARNAVVDYAAANTGVDAGIIGRAVDAAADVYNGRWWGNFGGPLYSGGRNLAPDEPITARDIEVKPRDKLDKLFKRHDLFTARAQTLATPKERADAVREADRIVIEEINDLLNRDAISGVERAAAIWAAAGFRAKLQYHKYSDPGTLRAGNPEDWRNMYDLELGKTIDDKTLGVSERKYTGPTPTISMNNTDDDLFPTIEVSPPEFESNDDGRVPDKAFLDEIARAEYEADLLTKIIEASADD